MANVSFLTCNIFPDVYKIRRKKMNRASWQIFLLVCILQKNYRKNKAQILCFKEHMEKIQKKRKFTFYLIYQKERQFKTFTVVSIFYLSVDFIFIQGKKVIYTCIWEHSFLMDLCLILLSSPSKSWLPTNACQLESLLTL